MSRDASIPSIWWIGGIGYWPSVDVMHPPAADGLSATPRTAKPLVNVAEDYDST